MYTKLIKKIARALTSNKIPYMIIGGQAVLIYGEPRITRDIDITLGINVDRLSDISVIIEKIKLKPLVNDVESFVKDTMVLPVLDEKSSIRIDFIFSFTDYEKQAIERSKKIKFDSQEVNFATPEDTIIHKIFSGRARDLEDVRTIMIKQKTLDKEYIRYWLKIFDNIFDEKKFLKIFEKINSSL